MLPVYANGRATKGDPTQRLFFRDHRLRSPSFPPHVDHAFWFRMLLASANRLIQSSLIRGLNSKQQRPARLIPDGRRDFFSRDGFGLTRTLF